MVEWKFPKKFLMRLEWVTVGFITGIIFLLSLFQLGLGFAVLFSAVFSALYLLIAYIVQMIRGVEHHYRVGATHLEITQKTRYGQTKAKVPLKKIKHHKLDHFFLGGYVVTDKDKHLVFFNTRRELEKFEKILRKHVKK